MGHLLTLFGGAQNYAEKVQATPGLIAYWPLDEQSGTVAYDRSGNGRNGQHTGVELGAAGIGDGRTCPLYDGVGDYTNIYSASLAGAFNGAEGTLIAWAKVANAGVWTDGVGRYVVNVNVDSSNNLSIRKNTAANVVTILYSASGVGVNINIATSTTGWVPYALTWSKAADQTKAYASGAQSGATLTGLGVWVGALNASWNTLGSQHTGPASVWSGTLAHVSLFNRALSPVEIARLSRV